MDANTKSHILTYQRWINNAKAERERILEEKDRYIDKIRDKVTKCNLQVFQIDKDIVKWEEKKQQLEEKLRKK